MTTRMKKNLMVLAFALLSANVWADIDASGKCVISINFDSRSDYAAASVDTTSSVQLGLVTGVPGTSWNNQKTRFPNGTAVNETMTNVKMWNGSAVVDSTVSISYKANNNWQKTDRTDSFLKGYLDDGGDRANVRVTGIPFKTYSVIVYCGTDNMAADKFYAPVTVNNAPYRSTGTGIAIANNVDSTTDSRWGDTTELTAVLWKNTLQIDYLSGDLTVRGGNNGNSARGGIAAIQIVECTETIPSDALFHVLGPQPTTAAEKSLTGNLSMGTLTDIDQTIGVRPAEVVKLTGADATTYNIFGGWDQGATGGTLNKDVWIKASVGTYNAILGGSYCNWGGADKKNVGNATIQLDGDAEVRHIVGGYFQDKGSPAWNGNVNIIVKDNAVVKGSIIGASTTAHNQTTTFTGNTHVNILNLQNQTTTGAIVNNAAVDSSGYIVGGGMWGWNSDGTQTLFGNTEVVVNTTDSGNFTKNIVGGGFVPANQGNASRNNPTIKVQGNTSVSITAPNANFMGTIVAGGYVVNPGSPSTPVTGTATLTLNGGNFSAATLKGGTATGTKKLVVNESAESTFEGFNEIDVASTKTLTLKSGATLGGVENVLTKSGAGVLVLGNDAASDLVITLSDGAITATRVDLDVVPGVSDKMVKIVTNAGVSTYMLSDAVAKIDDQRYASLQEALTHAVAGNTVTLLAANNETVAIPVDVTVDTADFNFTGSVSGQGVLKVNSFSKINNGTVQTSLKAEGWSGTVKVSGCASIESGAVTSTKTTLNNYGNEHSRIEFENCSGSGTQNFFGLSHDTNPIVVAPEIVVTGTLYLGNGYSHTGSAQNNYTIFRKLSGSGTLSCANASQLFYILDGSDFTGGITTSGKKFVFGERNATSDAAIENGEVVIRSTAAAPTVSTSWLTQKLTIESDQSLTVDNTNDVKLRHVAGGTLVKKGTGTLKLQNVSNLALDGTCVDIVKGKVELCGTEDNTGDAIIHDASFIIGADSTAALDNHGWFTVSGSLTIDNATDKTVFTNRGGNNAKIKGTEQTFVKTGEGVLTLACYIESSSVAPQATKLNGGSLVVKDTAFPADSVTTDLTGKLVEYTAARKTYSLVTAPYIVTINGVATAYASFDMALASAAAAATTPTITLVDGQDVPAGFVKASEDSNVIIAAKYVVISPSNYVADWKAYVTARAESPVAAGITFAVKNADEIYAAYPAKADNVNGDPRNDAESIHKWIGLMQKLGTKYFVLGSRWKDAQKDWSAGDRATYVPGVVAYPTVDKTSPALLDHRASDLYYACHYRAEEQAYVWDPNGDGTYVGLRETSVDDMADRRHFMPSCVVSRMDFYSGSRTYQQSIADYTAKLLKTETQEFPGADRYVAWTAQCKSFDASGLPDVYGVMKERVNSIDQARGAKELLHLLFLNIEPTVENPYPPAIMSESVLAENKASLYNGNWEIFLPFGHGTPDGFAGLGTEEFATSTGLIKFFMANIPCLTGSQTALCNAASAALANPTGGSLVSVNNASYGYLTDAGIQGRYCGLSDELADHCLDAYVDGANAGEAWKTAIATLSSKIFTESGINTENVVARGYTGEEDYIYATIVEQMLFGDPLVKIQVPKNTNRIVATLHGEARDHGLSESLLDTPVPATKIVFGANGGSTFTTGAEKTAWLDSWGGEQNGSTKRMVGPAGTLVPMVFHDGNAEAEKWHPYKNLKKTTFSIASYVNLDTATINTADRAYGIIWTMGNNSDTEVVLAFDAEKNLVVGNLSSCNLAQGAELATIAHEKITKGWHLVTVTFDTTNGITLTLDDGADGKSVSNSGIKTAPSNNGFQIGGVFQGTGGQCSNPKNLGLAEMLMFDEVLSARQILALAVAHPVVNSATLNTLDLGLATVDASLMDLTVSGTVSGTGKLVVGGSIAGFGTITNLELANGATLDVSARTLTATTLSTLPVALNVILAADADLSDKVELMTAGGLSAGEQATTVAVTKKGEAGALADSYKLSVEDGKLYLVQGVSHPDILIPVSALTTDKNAKVKTFKANGVDVKIADGCYVVPYGATVTIILMVADPDSYVGPEQRVENLANVTSVEMIVGHATLEGYAEKRVPIVEWNSSEVYDGEMRGLVIGSGTEGATYIRPGDTVIFGKSKLYEVPTPVRIGPNAVGAQLWVQRTGIAFAANEDSAILGGKTVVIDADKTLTLDTATRAMILGANVTFNEGTVGVTGANGLKTDSITGTALVSVASGSKIVSATASSPVNVYGRIGGGGTIDDNVSMKAGSRVVRSGDEYLTVTGFFSSHIALQNPEDEVHHADDYYHRIMIDALNATVTPDGEGYVPITLIQLANAEDAARMVKYIDIVAPELRDEDGNLIQIPWELAVDGSKIVLRVANFRPAEGFFTDGILLQDEIVDYPNDAVFKPNPGSTVDKIAVTGPAMISFTFAEDVDTTTVTLPITVDGGAIVFNVPAGKTVHINSAITGTGGVVKTGAGTLVFGAPDGRVYDDSTEQEAYWNTFEGALIIEGGLVRTDKKHGYGAKHTLADGTVDAPTIEIHSGATLDIGHTCTNEYLKVFCAGTITNSVHYADHSDIGQIGELVLDGDSVMCGHTFGMARGSTINLKQHRLTISMDRTTSVETVNPDGTHEFHDHEFELDNTTIFGCRNDWEDPDIVVVQGTLSIEGSTYDAATDKVTLGKTDMHEGALKLCKDASLRLEAILDVDTLVTEDANAGDIVVPCPTHGEHRFQRFWEESVKGATDTKHEDHGYIIIGHKLHGGIRAPRVCFGRANDAADFTQWIYLAAGEYIEVVENLENQRQFILQALDWTGDVGFRKAINAPKDYPLLHVSDAFLGVENPMKNGCWWYPTGSSWTAETVEYIPIRNDDNWLYMYQARKAVSGITTINGKPIYNDDKSLNEATVGSEFKDVDAGTLVGQEGSRGVAQIDIVIEPDWMKRHGYTEEEFGTYRAFLNGMGANGVERWQSYMLGLNPDDRKSLPVLSVRKDGVPPSETKDGVTYLNVSAAGVAEVGYNFIEPVYQIQEVTVDGAGKLTPVESTLTPWQRSPNFQVPVPAVGADGHVRYFRVNVSFQPVK